MLPLDQTKRFGDHLGGSFELLDCPSGVELNSQGNEYSACQSYVLNAFSSSSRCLLASVVASLRSFPNDGRSFFGVFFCNHVRSDSDALSTLYGCRILA